jgi:hypothetical protein
MIPQKKASQKRPPYAQQFSEIETIDHAERKRGKPCQTEAEKEGIQPIALRANGTLATAQFDFRADSWEWPPSKPPTTDACHRFP